MKDVLTIITVCDESYLKFVRVLFNSIKVNVKIPFKFHLHAINIPDKVLDSFSKNYNNLTISKDNIILDDTPNKDIVFKKSKKECYCANIRANVLLNLLEKENKYILYLDADSIVRKDLNHLLNLLKKNDIIIFRRDYQEEPRLKVLTSLIGLNNNNNTKKFIENWKHYMMQEKILYSWYSDQLYFYETMNEMPDVSISTVPVAYVDSGFKNNSFIWNGKANRKHVNIIYQKEMECYIYE